MYAPVAGSNTQLPVLAEAAAVLEEAAAAAGVAAAADAVDAGAPDLAAFPPCCEVEDWPYPVPAAGPLLYPP